ncbi:hypothetical protein HanLR1_Chr17g0656531 [Helianthus annuus]|nr:hypothetical protein HanHA89_Chr17g0697991 [Helianthus annuus]KAJ0631668.1 hypothetical protein HanLR1_Chr17g0656531 [Helianthus annuus]
MGICCLFFWCIRLEALNEKRSWVVQLVNLADKERESLESVKNEAEDYMNKEVKLAIKSFKICF